MEFAKRLYYKGQEISPFPIHGIVSSYRNYSLLTQELMSAEKKGWLSDSVTLAIKSLSSTILCRSSRWTRSFTEKARISEIMIKIIREPENAVELLGEIIRMAGVSWRPLSDYETQSVLQQLAMTSFVDSDPTKGEGTLGVLPEEVIISLYSDTEGNDNIGASLVDAFPYLTVYGLVTESYQRTVSALDGEGT